MSNETKPDGFPNRSYESGYDRGRSGEGSSEGFFDGWFDTPAEKADRNQGYEDGRKDRIRFDRE